MKLLKRCLNLFLKLVLYIGIGLMHFLSKKPLKISIISDRLGRGIVERLAVAVLREHARLAEADVRPRREHHVHARYHGDLLPQTFKG